jgi:hypothetical protein
LAERRLFELMKLLNSMIVAAVLCWAGAANAQTVALRIDAGLLENSTGTAPVPIGGLLQLLASPTGTFGSPTTSSFAGGNDVIVENFAMNYNSGTTGEVTITFSSISLSAAGVSAGEDLILRWYPTLTYSVATNYQTTGPSLLTTYGQARSDTIEFSPAVDPSETIWVVPAAGSTVDLDYITTSDGGSYSNTSGYAANLVTGVPEPSTWALAGSAFGFMIALRAWSRRSGATTFVASVPR